NLAQIQVTQGKNAEGLEQSPGNVPEREDQRGLIRTFMDFLFLLDKEKPGKVLFVILKTGLQDMPSILFRRLTAGNGSGITQATGHDMLHASGCVIESNWFNFCMLPKKIATLVQSHRMRKHLPELFQGDSRGGDQAVLDPQPHLPQDE